MSKLDRVLENNMILQPSKPPDVMLRTFATLKVRAQSNTRAVVFIHARGLGQVQVPHLTHVVPTVRGTHGTCQSTGTR